MITAYLYNSCTSCRKTEALLTESGIEWVNRQFFKQPITRNELTDILEKAGVSLRDLLSTRSTPYKAMGLAARELADDELLQLMLGEPRLLRRPIVVGEGGVVIGHNPTRLQALIEAERAQ